MTGIYYLLPTLILVAISLLVVRAGAIALMMTGMNYEKAKFQALSAFTGTGFTTREAERVVNNARRRKIISWLMILGNAGIVSVIVTTTSSFAMAKGIGIGVNVLVLAVGLGLIVYIVRKTKFVRRWEEFAQDRLRRLKIFEDDTTVDELLHITEGYSVVRIALSKESPLVGQTLSQVNASMENSFVLGIERDKSWMPTPRLTRKLMEGDILVVYGKMNEMANHFG